MANRQAIVNQIIRGSRLRGLDPNAVLAVAGEEGLGGGVGDSGHAFGPFQLNDAGGVLTGRPGNHRAFAESPQGIAYALDQIARVARGRRGRDAIAQIVSRFERPADIPGEIARASSHYGRTLPMARGGLTRPSGGISGPGGNTRSPLSPAILGVINAGNAMFGWGPLPAASLPQVQRPRQRQQGNLPPMQTGKGTPYKGGRTIKFLEHFAAPFGLTVTATTNGHHVKGSYHYKGRAVDFGGDPQNMAALARTALMHPQDFTELFYTGPGNPGYYIKNGKVYPNSKLDRSVYANHHDHVHAAR